MVMPRSALATAKVAGTDIYQLKAAAEETAAAAMAMEAVRATVTVTLKATVTVTATTIN